MEKKILGIAAGKGGVGKSTLTVCLARALQRKGVRAAILDADLYGPSIPRMLGQDTPPSSKEGFVVPAVRDGIEFFSCSSVLGAATAVRAPIANAIIQQCKGEIAWSEPDVLLIDFPPGTGDIQLTLLQTFAITGMLFVITPELVALSDAERAIRMTEQMGVPTLGLVENKGVLIEQGREIELYGKGLIQRFAEEKGRPFFGELPLDGTLTRSMDRGEDPFGRIEKKTLLCIEKIAENVIRSVFPLGVKEAVDVSH